MNGQSGAAWSSRPDRDASEDVEHNVADLALLERMRGGDESALATFYDRWSNRVYSLALRLLREARDAEDIVEETFWQAWRNAARFDATRGGVGTWLLTICRSRALDRIRARRRKQDDAALDDDAQYESSQPDPSATMVANETGRIVRAALAELPDEQRQAVELAYFRGLSQSEIAEKTGQPLGTVKTRVRLAMAKLREKLGVLQEVRP
jgi:RNA polymerase sigma-70 factor (ECF subfamily)